ncbi:5'-nucleotidase, lipoprotein e(P4) family [Staphylococcus agnetis]|uniref:5'-nucleotidase, lipoprotein e(P4) family n=1 Tax=Staphylococcus agnetis TaxID=985762 RepID=UPI000D02AB1E|nr:5'-nucleotidase, lipoprotein e(P4) family [Staphylococcus agnetis]MCO4325528.1 5'-nucleotidase, lipoprotein e(P4) family [Staphylococcus agnetis]MCO4337517.1 5'-nucleotidase, lipoprotein e(P4) family [Staphylococcus agnetis]MCO4339914.1 5'-nucleotidase, lipoprotein e(P4) family [Staphylococcus agnetis]MCO4342320.1 5'-nucleotidase, lipoprotein e(P4) family [Staphylococcus agnetis]MCO4344556.1 5'-nucleotidase, lipoprotein e(P4) family [Staphylococcus agnetis]
MNKWTKTATTLLALGMITSTVPSDTFAGAEAPTQQTQTQTESDYVKQLSEQNVMSVAWYQNSAEAKALYAQGYNSAKETLSKKIKHHKGGKKLAIVLDIDETVLDNSPFQAASALNGTSFPTGWHEWVKSAQAKPVYGAKDFLTYADKHDVEIFYVSDRSHEKDLDATIKNLKKEKLPQADKKHVLLKKAGDKSKEERRDKVRSDYNLVMLFGDNLLDFEEPKEATQKSRDELVRQHEDDFGSKYIIFPNPMYGSWEATLYNNDYSISAKQKVEKRKQSLKYFDMKTNKVKTYQGE